MPKFQRFDRRSAPINKRPAMTLQRSGAISLNQAAFKLVGEPETVELLYDPEERIVGLRRTDPEAPHAYPCHRQGRGSTHLVNAIKFAKHFGIVPDSARRYFAKSYGDGVIGIDLKEDGIEVTSPRDKSLAANVTENGHIALDSEEVRNRLEGSTPRAGS